MKLFVYILLFLPYLLNAQNFVDSALVNFTGVADTPDGWTNITTASEGTWSLNDSDTEWSVTFTYDQGGALGLSNQGDQTASTYFNNWPTNVCSVYWYTSNADSFNLKIKGLDPQYSYTFHLMGNRSLTEVREQELIINGTIDTMDVGDETDGCMGIIEDIYPDGDSIMITVKPITVGYAYINGLKIFEEDMNRSPLATPNAKGFGSENKGAMAGSEEPTILYVDRLTNDLGNDGVNHGSFRWCITRTYPRVILFKVSGYIPLPVTGAEITDPYISIYGQSAPDPGITFTGNPLKLGSTCHHVIMENLRFRANSSFTSLFIYDGVKNVFINNCSFSYMAQTVYVYDVDSITFQNCLFSNSTSYDGGKGIHFGGQNVTFVQNAFIHCATGSPYFITDSVVNAEVVNNIAYNPSYWGIYSDHMRSGSNLSIIGNKAKPGLSTTGGIGRQTLRLGELFSTDVDIYLSDNAAETRVGTSNWDGIVSSYNSVDSTDVKVETPFSWALTADWPVTSIEDSLNIYAGSRPWKRDSVDILALNDMLDSTGERINLISEAYWPELDSFYLVPPVPSSPWVVAGNGFTNFENWIYTYQGVSPDDPCSSTLLKFNETIAPSVNGAATGAIYLNMTGGVPPYNYDWDNDSTTSSITNLTPGDYTVTVTDDNTCTGEETFTVINLKDYFLIVNNKIVIFDNSVVIINK